MLALDHQPIGALNNTFLTLLPDGKKLSVFNAKRLLTLKRCGVTLIYMRAPKTHDITPDLLIKAYSMGLFPMADDAEDDTLYWMDPEERGIFPLDGFVISRSLAKTLRADPFDIAIDRDFDAVIAACAARDRTWINDPIRRLYRNLFDRGIVHSVECRLNGALVGGLYGVALGGVFCGESMFHLARDASKVALLHLAARLRLGGFCLLDTQFVTPHLASLGAIAIPREKYHAALAGAIRQPADFYAYPADKLLAGEAVLTILRAT